MQTERARLVRRALVPCYVPSDLCAFAVSHAVIVREQHQVLTLSFRLDLISNFQAAVSYNCESYTYLLCLLVRLLHGNLSKKSG